MIYLYIIMFRRSGGGGISGGRFCAGQITAAVNDDCAHTINGGRRGLKFDKCGEL